MPTALLGLYPTDAGSRILDRPPEQEWLQDIQSVVLIQRFRFVDDRGGWWDLSREATNRTAQDLFEIRFYEPAIQVAKTVAEQRLIDVRSGAGSPLRWEVYVDGDAIPPETVWPDGRSRRLHVMFDVIIAETRLEPRADRHDQRRVLSFIGQTTNSRTGASPEIWIERVRIHAVEVEGRQAQDAATEFFLSAVAWSFGNFRWRGQPISVR